MIKKTSPVTYIIKHQLDGSTTKVHAENIRKAYVDDWVMPNAAGAEGRILRKANYVVPPGSEEPDTSTSSLSSEDMPLARNAKRYPKERDDSDNEDYIPQMERAKCIRNQEKQDESDADSVSSSNSTMSYSLEEFKVPVSVKIKERSNNSHESLSESSDTNMSVNEACAAPL